MPQPYILAIDTSCDETAVAVVQGHQVISNVVASQVELHKPYGGVFPTVAKQAHRENIAPATAAALRRAHLTSADIAAVAVTQGPGLAPALEVGIEFAQKIAAEWQVPLLGINHLEGHVLSVLATPKPRPSSKSTSARPHELPPALPTPEKPVLAVMVSGRHTEFIAIPTIGTYHKLGGSVDDAAGEALDKVGRMLDFGYPAGPVIEEFARRGNPTAYPFPLPMTTSGDYNLSFSGLKTYARNKIETLSGEHRLTKTEVFDFSASFQRAVFRSICYKLNKILQHQQFNEVWLGGGVAANAELRHQLRLTLKPFNLKLRVPYTKKLCGDNAAMIGVVASYQLNQFLSGGGGLSAPLDRKPRWELESLSSGT